MQDTSDKTERLQNKNKSHIVRMRTIVRAFSSRDLQRCSHMRGQRFFLLRGKVRLCAEVSSNENAAIAFLCFPSAMNMPSPSSVFTAVMEQAMQSLVVGRSTSFRAAAYG